MNYYIKDCYGQIIGNPKGYATIRGAIRAEKNRSRLIWNRFYSYKDNGGLYNTVSTITQGKENEN